MGKVAKSQQKAAKKYRENKEVINLLLAPGTKQKIRDKIGGESIAKYIRDLITVDLLDQGEKSEVEKTDLPDCFLP